MTVIVAVKDRERGGVIFGVDSLYNLDEVTYNALDEKKYSVSPNGIVIGGAGGSYLSDVIQEFICAQKIDKDVLEKEDVFELVNLLYVYLKERDLVNDKGEMSEPCEFILTYKESIYTISQDFHVIEVKDSVATGSGRRMAFGALKNDNSTPFQKVVRAIEVADKYVNSVGFPAFIYDNVTKEEITINREDVKDVYCKKD